MTSFFPFSKQLKQKLTVNKELITSENIMEDGTFTPLEQTFYFSNIFKLINHHTEWL